MQPRPQPAAPPAPPVVPPPEPFFSSPDGRFVLYQGDSLELLSGLGLQGKASMVFAS